MKSNSNQQINPKEVDVQIKPEGKAMPKLSAMPMRGFMPKDGEYHLVRLDKEGKEIPGTDVSVPVNTYNRTFSKRTDYLVKKNPK